MIRSLSLLAVVMAVAYAARVQDVPEEVRKLTGEALTKHINAQGKWQAEIHSRFAGKTKHELKNYLGAMKKPAHFRRRGQHARPAAKKNDAPASFNSIDQWPQCAGVIGLIQDQSACGSCWAVSTTSAMSDRLCIASNAQIQVSISSLDLMACCGYDCGFQCNGGWPDEAWYYWTDTGVVTGGNYTADLGCKPYPIAPCWIDKKTQQIACPDEPTEDYTCQSKCQASYTDETYDNDHYYGDTVSYFSGQNDEVIAELIANGPLVAAFDVYEDFYQYKNGIYEYTGGDFVGGHAVRIVGYGTENGTPYWLVANSWDNFWGENGYFRIRRDTDECGFEDEITSATADVARSLKNK